MMLERRVPSSALSSISLMSASTISSTNCPRRPISYQITKHPCTYKHANGATTPMQHNNTNEEARHPCINPTQTETSESRARAKMHRGPPAQNGERAWPIPMTGARAEVKLGPGAHLGERRLGRVPAEH
jgi:hypothetical protein